MMSSPRRLAALALPVILAACLSASSTPTPATGSVSGDGTTVAVSLVEYAFEPFSLSVPAGPITFSLRNDGNEEHEFEILRGDQVVDELEGLLPGLEQDFGVTLEAGDYTVVCRLADHEQRGMTGTLTVTEG